MKYKKYANANFVIDINSAFGCIVLEGKGREKALFTTKDGKFVFKVLPFGLETALPIFKGILSNTRNDLDEFVKNKLMVASFFLPTRKDRVDHISKFLHVT